MIEFIELTASGSEQPMFFRKTCIQQFIPIKYRDTLVVTTWGSTNCKETPEEIMAFPRSHTGRYLKQHLAKSNGH